MNSNAFKELIASSNANIAGWSLATHLCFDDFDDHAVNDLNNFKCSRNC